MRDEATSEKLDAAIGDIVSRGESASTGDEDLDALGRLATGLRGLPRSEFRSRLRAEFELASGRATIPASPSNDGHRTANRGIASWLRGQRPFLAAGSSFGLAAGACCLSGLAANVLGIASADTVRAFISNTLPYFVALSLAGLAGWIVWFLREQGVTPATVSGLIRQHGLAIGSSYAAVFAVSMALANLRGIY